MIEPTPQAIDAMAVAERLITEAARQGMDVPAMFAAFMGYIAQRDEYLGAQCLFALGQIIAAESSTPGTRLQ